MRFILNLKSVCVCMVLSLAGTASAQERLDSSTRAWADVGIYSGDMFTDDYEVTAVTPVLRGELELSSWQLGLDLPLALGDASIEANETIMSPAGDGFAGHIANPTLHVDYVLESKPIRFSAGIAVAIPTTNEDSFDETDERGDGLVTSAAMYSRAMMNIWWYVPNTWTLVAPVAADYVSSESEFGFDGALGLMLPRRDGSDNVTIMQLGMHAAAVADPGVIGVRLQGVFFSEEFISRDDNFQSSAELFAELRLPIVWLGAGFLFAIDEPLGLGDGGGFWGLRLSGGASF